MPVPKCSIQGFQGVGHTGWTYHFAFKFWVLLVESSDLLFVPLEAGMEACLVGHLFWRGEQNMQLK